MSALVCTAAWKYRTDRTLIDFVNRFLMRPDLAVQVLLAPLDREKAVRVNFSWTISWQGVS